MFQLLLTGIHVVVVALQNNNINNPKCQGWKDFLRDVCARVCVPTQNDLAGQQFKVNEAACSAHSEMIRCAVWLVSTELPHPGPLPDGIAHLWRLWAGYQYQQVNTFSSNTDISLTPYSPYSSLSLSPLPSCLCVSVSLSAWWEYWWESLLVAVLGFLSSPTQMSASPWCFFKIACATTRRGAWLLLPSS